MRMHVHTHVYTHAYAPGTFPMSPLSGVFSNFTSRKSTFWISQKLIYVADFVFSRIFLDNSKMKKLSVGPYARLLSHFPSVAKGLKLLFRESYQKK